MKSENDKKGSGSIILIVLLTAAVAAAIMFVVNTEKNELEKKIYTLSSEINGLNDRIDDLTQELKHKQMAVELLYESSDLEEQLKTSMKPLAPKLPNDNDFAENITDCGNSELFEHNKMYFSRIQTGEPSYIVDYISTDSGRTTRYITMTKVKLLSDEICEGKTSKLDKVNAIAEWVVHNIYYNEDAASTAVDTDVISLEQVLSAKTTTCAGYSDLFAALCQAQGICAVNMKGSAKEDLADDPEWKTARTNHEWNAVYIEDGWHFYDTTWCSKNFYSDGKYFYSDKTEDNYLDMDFGEMSKHRRIDRADFRDFYTALFSIYTNPRL